MVGCSGSIVNTVGIGCERSFIVLVDENWSELSLHSVDSKIIQFHLERSLDSIHSQLFGMILEETDSIGLPVTDVIVKDLLMGTVYETSSDLDGAYEFDLPPSEYEIQFQFIGFNTLRVKRLKIEPRQTIHMNVLLGEGQSVSEVFFDQWIKTRNDLQ